MSLQPGEIIADRFEIERLAGEGGMGTVFRARDRDTGLPVALKTLHDAEAQAVARLVREARVLGELHHPRIVRYVAHGTTAQGDPFLAMEWLEGEDLGERLAREDLGVAESVALARHVAGALGAAHARGVLHRDIKPSNLFLVGGRVDRVKLLDFGIARGGAGATSTRVLTRTGAVVGTPGYMAPEQARGERALDARADVFALGAVLFECLAGRPAFVGANVMALLAALLVETPPRLRSLRPEVPAALDALVAAMMAREPADRPADAAAVIHALDALGLPASATPAPASGRPAAPGRASESAGPTPANRAAVPRWTRFREGALWAGDRDDALRVVRIVRSPEPLELEQFAAAVEELRRALAGLRLSEWAIVFDLREGPLRTDDAFERTAAALLTFTAQFGGRATVVRSAVGQLQSTRIGRAAPAPFRAFDNAADALAFALEQRDAAAAAQPR